MFKSYLKYSAEDREWIERTRGAPAGWDAKYQRIPATPPELAAQSAAWKPPKGTELAAQSVNAMTADAQWGYRADASTRGALPKGWGKPKAAAKRVNAKDARIAELEGEVERLRGLLAEREAGAVRRLLAERGEALAA